MKRIHAFDELRGIGVLAVVFFHASLFHYKNVASINFDNPPVIVVIIGFMLMWSGLFAIISGASNGYSLLGRFNSSKRIFYASVAYFLFYMFCHYLYFIVLGPMLLDFETLNHKMSIVSSIIRGNGFPVIYAQRIFYMTSLSMLALNGLIIGVFMVLLKKVKSRKIVLNIILLSAVSIILISISRIYLYPIFEKIIESKNYLLTFILAPFINKNDPLLPYTGFGLFGLALGYMFHYKIKKIKISLFLIVSGIMFLATGITGYMMLPDTMLERTVDMMWFFIIIMQLGLFFIMISIYLQIFNDSKRKFLAFAGRVSLTIFMLETPVSDVLALAGNKVFPGWNENMGTTFIFAGVNIIVWIVIALIISRIKTKLIFEYAYKRFTDLFGRASIKYKAVYYEKEE